MIDDQFNTSHLIPFTSWNRVTYWFRYFLRAWVEAHVSSYHIVQATTAIVDTVLVESTAIVEQKPLTTQFYLLLVESPF